MTRVSTRCDVCALVLPALAGLLCRQFGETTLVRMEVEAWLLRSITVDAGVGGA